jgi:malate dehydrogenase
MLKKRSIIGSGAVGSSLAFNIICRLDIKELVLLDISSDLAKGVALDLEDTRGFLDFSTTITGTKDFSQIKDSDIVVITAGVARKEGMSRLDLLKINAEIAKGISYKIKKYTPNSIIIVVTNPLDIITYVVNKETKISRYKILGMGSSLDTARLFNLIHKETRLSTSSFGGFVFGLHSNDMIVSMRRIRNKEEPIYKFLEKNKIKALQERVRYRGGEIVGFLKNKSAHFAPSLSCYYLIEAIANDKNEIIPVSVLLKGEYGLKNICMGVPCVINKKGIEKIIEIKLAETEKKEIGKIKKLFKECMI